jgi:hypothetical protein
MAYLTTQSAELEDLRRLASELIPAVDSIATLLEEEATRLRRRDQMARLNSLRSAVLEGVEHAKSEERIARSAHSQVSTITSSFRLGAGLVMMTSKNKTARAISRELLAGPGGGEPTFGTVLVCVGPKGIPEDVDVVSISRLGRESSLCESEVMDGLLRSGNLLLGIEAFSLLIGRLAAEIMRGMLCLPVPTGKLTQLQEPIVLRLTSKNTG